MRWSSRKLWCCLAVVAAGVLTAGGGWAIAATTQTRSVDARSGQVATRWQLLQTLGVLRTRPTATDRAAAACIERTFNKYGEYKCYRNIPDYGGTVIWETEHPAPVALGAIASLGDPKWDLTGIRIVPLGSSGESVTFYPGNWRGTIERGDTSTAPSGKRNWGVLTVFAARGNQAALSLPTTVPTLRAHGIAVVLFARSFRSLRLAIIVPDGVARVAVGSVTLGSQRWLENLTAAVHDNIGTLKLRTPNSRYDGLQSAVAKLTWFGPRGELIKHTTTAMQWGG